MLENLNEKQLEAITHKEGPLLILAGAGSGKTRVLTTRIAYLIENENINPYNILAITFTNKAAGEMKARIEGLIGKTNISCSTFHSFGVKILRENFKELGYESNFVIMDSDDTLTLVKKILKDLNYDPKIFSPYMIKNRISSNKNEFIMPDEFSKFIHSEVDDVTYKVYKRYQDTLFQNNAVDFDDLLILPIKLFRTYPEVLQKYQERYKYILIDEYQDTNHAQYLLTKMISAKYKNLCVVGDNDQCLIEGTIVQTKDGLKKVEDIKVGDEILAGFGNGDVSYAHIDYLSKEYFSGTTVKITTKTGKSVTATPNHIVFTKINLEEDKYYIYIMYKKGLGYRIGQTSSVRSSRGLKKANGLMIRLHGEHADRIWCIKVCNNKNEASYFEEYYACKYGLPKVVFRSKGRAINMMQEDINKLFHEIDTIKNGEKLMNDEFLYFDYPHHFAQAVTTKSNFRKIININFSSSRKNLSRGTYAHRVYLNTTGQAERKFIESKGYSARDSKAATWRIETERPWYDAAEYLAYSLKQDLAELYDYDIYKSIKLTKEKKYMFMPIGSLREGMSIPVLEDDELVDDVIESIEHLSYDGYVYDFSLPLTRNFIANSIAVHNSIYSFRGANYKNILNFEKDYPDAKVVLLEQNYRSTKTVLDAANSVIKNNDQRKEKNLWTANEEGDKITYYKALNETDEVHFIIRKIKDLLSKKVKLSEIAILYRTNAQSRVFEQELLRQNVPFRIIGSFYFYSRKEIKDLLSYLRLIHNSSDNISLMRAINTPKRGIGDKTVANIEKVASDFRTSMFEAISSGKELEFKNLIMQLKEDSQNNSLTDLIDIVLDKSGMRKALKEEKTLEADIRLENLEEFKSVTKSFEERIGIISLEEFLLEVSLVSDVEEYKDDPNRVTLMTVHSVKGLEFPYVFIVGLEEGLFPHKNSIDSKDEIEEERRLMYVAITRAMKKLFITNAKRRMIFGQETVAVTSRFFNEIEEEYIEHENAPDKKIVKKENKFHSEDQDYVYGDKVTHDIHGIGVVIEITSTILTVAFRSGIGIKKIMKNHKSIKKL